MRGHKYFWWLFSLLMTGFLLAGTWACSGGDEPAGGDSSPPGSKTSIEASDASSSLGVGPIQEPLNLPPSIDDALAQKGEQIFQAKCVACHKLDERFVGPPLRGVTRRRRPEWIMNMILNPEGMIREDPIARQMVQEYNGAIMANQGLTEEEARALLEFFRKVDQESSTT